MKDSRLGTYGVTGLIGILSAKFLLLKELPKFSPDLANPSINIFLNYKNFLLVLIAAHAISRLMGVFTICLFDYVTDPDGSKSKPVTSSRPSFVTILMACLFALLPFVFLPWHFALAIIPVLLIAYRMAVYFKKWIGGYTGDCLGAIQQVSELTFYLGVLIVWQYII
nr:adenosylcobinamide-GDP ribazoletransferase [Paraflavitalea speifideiaquila]